MVCSGVAAAGAAAQPVFSDWPVATPSAVSAVAAAPLAGWMAVADVGDDTVEIRDGGGTLVRTLNAADLEGPVGVPRGFPGAEGPVAMAFSDSGLALFVALRTDLSGTTTDLIRRVDLGTGAITTFASLDLGQTTSPTGVSLAFFKGRLYVAGPTFLRGYRALSSDASGVQLSSQALSGVSALAVDRDLGNLFVSLNGTLFRAALPSTSLVGVGITGPLTGLAWHDHFGAASGNTGPGLFALNSGGATVVRIPAAQARGAAAFVPATYTTLGPPVNGFAATAEGGFLASRGAGAVVLRDATDTDLSFNAWAIDEFAQHVAFARSLITPNLAPANTPAGWVIDADVQEGWTRFHPATPDAAAWTVMLLLMNEELTGDPAARGQLTTILTRYAGLAPDGVAPVRSVDGIYRHWMNPMDGELKPGWPEEFATLSTMKMVHAAARAWARYPDDPAVEAAARAIICGVRNWDAYSRGDGREIAFVGLENGGPDGSSWSRGWHEGMLFAEQAGAYGGANGDLARIRWTSPSGWPLAFGHGGLPVTGVSGGQFLPAFITGYAALWSEPFRASLGWQFHTLGLRLSNMAWSDDNGPRYATVFSAGTTRAEWGGYHADSLTDHPGSVTTFPSLLALLGRPLLAGESARADAVGAYQAYRRGARQRWLGGAELLYRRSDEIREYSPNSAGLPDAALGGLGLAELIAPGSVAAVLSGEYPSCGCPADRDGDEDVDSDDIAAFFGAWEVGEGDVDGDDDSDSDDVVRFFVRWNSGC